MASKSINDSVGPNSILLTLLVFGAIPRLGPPGDPPRPSTLQHAIAVWEDTDKMSRHCAKRQFHDAVQALNSPDVSDIHKASIGSPVLVYHSEKYM